MNTDSAESGEHAHNATSGQTWLLISNSTVISILFHGSWFLVPDSFLSRAQPNSFGEQVWPGARMRSLNRKWNRHYRFRALSEEDMRGWMDAINATSAFLSGKGGGGASQEGGSGRGSGRGRGRGLQGERRSWPYRKNTHPPSGSHTDVASGERSDGEGKVSSLNVDTTLQSSSLAPTSSSPTSAASSTSTVTRYAKGEREKHHKTCTTREILCLLFEQKQVESTDSMGRGGAGRFAQCQCLPVLLYA